MNSTILLIARILLAVIFVHAGFGKLTDISGTAGYFASYGLPGGVATAAFVGLLELLGGLAILVGFQTSIAAWALAIFSVASALVAHTAWGDMMQLVQFQKNLAIAGGLLALASYGAGALSVDARRGDALATA